MSEPIDTNNNTNSSPELPPALPENLSSDERYFTLFATALRKCLSYKPKFGTGLGQGLTVKEFQSLYGADPFYHWIGLDSPQIYAAHKAAGGMTSVYRQIGIGSQWIFYQPPPRLSRSHTRTGYLELFNRGSAREATKAFTRWPD